MVVFLDFSIGQILRTLYFKVPRKITYTIQESYEDIQIYGSSKANRHYNPYVFENELGLSCFNNGVDGRNIFYHYAAINSLLQRHKPKLIILDLLSEDYLKSDGGWNTDRLNVLLPYYNHNSYIKEVVNLRSPFERVKLLSSIYPFNSAIVDICVSIKEGKDRSIGYKGYIPLGYSEKSHEMNKVNFHKEYEIDELKINYLKKIIKTCNSNNIKLIIIKSPWYAEYPEKSSLLEEIAFENKITFWNFTNLDFFSERSFFYDESHLNEKGAELFTEFVVDKIKSEQIIDE